VVENAVAQQGRGEEHPALEAKLRFVLRGFRHYEALLL